MILNFHDGRETAIPLGKMATFEDESVYNRLYRGEETHLPSVMEEIGLCALDFTNVHGGSEDIADIDQRSTRLFTIWGEDSETNEVVGLVRGYIVLLPFTTSSPPDWNKYYSLQHEIISYPVAIISSFRAISLPRDDLDDFITQILDEISLLWQKVRKNTITRLPSGSGLWKRYVSSFKEIIHFSFTCPSIDRDIIEALKRKGFRLTGFLQLLSSPSAVYDQAVVKNHITSTKEIIDAIKR